ncbi:hypothetical protein FISHEDRAFT_62965 [Fistulina hepatica ATCC 64428]|uniref:Uncharacterized protein n=1 Tax=Fistulina hepatica ATCC 64428 TaxID=1128425 RepID=A0A0D7A0Y2_9AGAR|nr:hypothetical protein FISHEDRAFT_62965 [Fistulina hepatica ATCC 64428]
MTQGDSSRTPPRGPLNRPPVDDVFQAKYIKPPPKIAHTEATLNARLIYNHQSDTFNTFQVDASLFYMASADVDLQAEPELPKCPLYEFSSAEVCTFVTDADFRKKYEDYLEERDLGPSLPDDLLLAISEFHEKQLEVASARQPLGPSNMLNTPSGHTSLVASGTANKPKISYLGFIKENMCVFTEINYLGAKTKIVFPEEYQAAVINNHHVLLRLLLSDVIRSFMGKHTTIPVKKSIARSTDEEGKPRYDYFINNEAAIAKLGPNQLENGQPNLTYPQWLNASANMVALTALVCHARSKSEFAEHWANHFAFFRGTENPEITFPIWFSLEREFAELVRTSHAFNTSLWKQELSSTLRLAKLSGLSLTSSVANAFAAKHAAPAGPSNDEHTSKLAKLTPRSFQVPIQSFWRPMAPSNGNYTGASSSGALSSRAICFVCKGEHRYSEHPRNQTRDANGKAYFAVISNDGVLICASDDRKFCISFNIKGTCSHRHGCERLNICCSCGSDKHGLLGPRGCGSRQGN